MNGIAATRPADSGTARRYREQRLGFVVLVLAAIVVVAPILFLVAAIVVRGAGPSRGSFSPRCRATE